MKDFLGIEGRLIGIFIVLLIMIVVVFWLIPPSVQISHYETQLTEIAHCEALEEFTPDQCVLIVGGD